MQKPVKLNLVYTPFASFYSVPLGISYLKSYIEKCSEDVSVKNIDLNNSLFKRIEEKEYLLNLQDICSICKMKNKECKGILKDEKILYIRKKALLAKHLLKNSVSDDEPFYSIENYGPLMDIFDDYLKGLYDCISKVITDALAKDSERVINLLKEKIFLHDIDEIKKNSPDIIGFSVFIEHQLYYSLMLAKLIKKELKVTTVFGGALISHLDSHELLQIASYIDLVIKGEGEMALNSLCKNIHRKAFDAVPNLVYHESGKIISNSEDIIKDIDSIPAPDYTDFYLNEYFTPVPAVSTLLSRGCYWAKCAFCALRKTYSKYRLRSIKNIIDELKGYEQQGVRYVSFADEILTPVFLNKLALAMIEENINVYYGVFVKPKGFTREILSNIYKSGGRYFMWGVETTNQRILDLMEKGTNSHEIKKILKDSAEEGFFNFLFIIQGFPKETEEEIYKDKKFAIDYAEYFCDFGLGSFYLERGTPIYDNPERYDLSDYEDIYYLKTENFSLKAPLVQCKYKNRIDMNSEQMRKGDKLLSGYLRHRYASFLYSSEHMLIQSTRGMQTQIADRTDLVINNNEKGSLIE